MPLPSALQGDFVKVALKGVFGSLVLSAVMKVSAAMNHVEFEGSHIKGHNSAWIANGDLLCSSDFFRLFTWASWWGVRHH